MGEIKVQRYQTAQIAAEETGNSFFFQVILIPNPQSLQT
jgi:hypothetical protein